MGKPDSQTTASIQSRKLRDAARILEDKHIPTHPKITANVQLDKRKFALLADLFVEAHQPSAIAGGEF